MYIRCAVCQAATWLESLEPGVAELSVRCQQCDQEYSLLGAGELGIDAEEQYQRARQFAEYNNIDLPSAYSVMLGIMELDQARSARETRVRQTSDVATFTDEAPDEPLPYDEGFHLAVMEGCLTAEQATNRGNRRALAVRLSQRHGISLKRAYQVAENRLSLIEARKHRTATATPTPRVTSAPATRSQKALLLGFAAVIVAAVTFQGWRTWNTSRTPPDPVVLDTSTTPGEDAARARAEKPALDPVARAKAATEILTDPEGRVLSVAGPDPRSVLIAFCTSGAMTGRAEPVELARALPAFSGARLGLFRDADEAGALQAIRIIKDPRTRRWVAGDGHQPIPVADPPPFPTDHPRIPVSIE